MDKGILLIFCSFITLVQNFPIQLIDYVDPATGNLEVLEIIDDDYYDLEHKQSKKSILGPCRHSQNGDVRCFFEDENRKAKYEENLKRSPLPYIGDDFGTFFESQQDYDQLGPVYEQDLSNLEYPMNIEEMPYENPSYRGVNSHNLNEFDSPLPYYGTYIHGLIPSQDDTPVFNSNIYESQNMPLNLRMARASSYDEFLAQLSHDSMMNNILPTMSYLRNTGAYQRYQVPYGEAQAVASFPHAGARGCAQPILFGCSPTVYQGSLARWPSVYSHAPTPEVHIPLSYKPEHVPANHKGTGNYIANPSVVAQHHNYRKANVKLVPEKKL